MSTQSKKVNVADVEPNRRRGGDIRLTLSPRSTGATSGFGGRLTLAPGESVNRHYHPYSEEFVHLISGEALFGLGDEVVPLGPGDSLMVPIGVPHWMRNAGGEPVEVVFHLSPLAPQPALGHVDLEEPADAAAPHPPVGEAR